MKVVIKRLPYPILSLLIISLPIIGYIFNLESENNHLHEKRVLAPFPKLSTQKAASFTRELDQYLTDQHPFRELITKEANSLRAKLFKPQFKGVIVGKSNWLFYSGDDVIEDLQGMKTFDFESWIESINSKQLELDAQNIEYFLATIPNKSSVITEKRPWWLSKQPNVSRYKRIQYRLNETPSSAILDLGPSIENLKSKNIETYWSDDTHWNANSFLHSLDIILHRCRTRLPGLKNQKLLNHIVFVDSQEQGDLAKMAGLKNNWPRNRRRAIKVDPPSDFHLSSSNIQKLPYFSNLPKNHFAYPKVYERESGTGTAIIFHDSFLAAVAEPRSTLTNFPLALPFRRCISIWMQPSKKQILEIIKAEKPDLIIEQRVERYLYN